MASCLQKELNYKEIAEIYSKVNDFQVELGKMMVCVLGIKRGDKVLDIGCGTGEITAYIADTVTEDGLCVGFDPDKYRIEVAMKKHLPGRTNITFFNGDSSSKFPHANEEFYDYVLCSAVFHWMNEEEKLVFLKAAYLSLRPGGKLLIRSHEKNPNMLEQTQKLVADNDINFSRSPFKLVTKSKAVEMLLQNGFKIQSDSYFDFFYVFESLECYLTWFSSSAYLDKTKFLPEKVGKFALQFQKDGTVPLNVTFYKIVASRPTGF
ncbi:malonyl-[acyl-carrier protein] O-methyltransferase-like [Xenia sp. Carnegie-2017]|uniref:malonyl-[acyl-carrier protein] O-methyltransferase-like n=1 Tax=Xenia sp. Carnegie-2017 TaxID=2897299 RepID=UPI001F03AA5C|nr:malonyl-[acyl-carrier protein] O-methyltransferase-like [Xenia sp. Carnegie-2017]